MWIYWSEYKLGNVYDVFYDVILSLPKILFITLKPLVKSIDEVMLLRNFCRCIWFNSVNKRKSDI
jgi:hypothetical protein